MVSVEKIVDQTQAVAKAADALRAALDDCSPGLRLELLAAINLVDPISRAIAAKSQVTAKVVTERRNTFLPSASQMTAGVTLNGSHKYDGANDAVLATLKLRPMTFKELWATAGSRFHTASKKPKNVLYQATFALKKKGRIKKVAGKYTLA